MQTETNPPNVSNKQVELLVLPVWKYGWVVGKDSFLVSKTKCLACGVRTILEVHTAKEAEKDLSNDGGICAPCLKACGVQVSCEGTEVSRNAWMPNFRPFMYSLDGGMQS